MQEQEIWKDVVGYEGLYQVSNLVELRVWQEKLTMDNILRIGVMSL